MFIRHPGSSNCLNSVSSVENAFRVALKMALRTSSALPLSPLVSQSCLALTWPSFRTASAVMWHLLWTLQATEPCAPPPVLGHALCPIVDGWRRRKRDVHMLTRPWEENQALRVVSEPLLQVCSSGPLLPLMQIVRTHLLPAMPLAFQV